MLQPVRIGANFNYTITILINNNNYLKTVIKYSTRVNYLYPINAGEHKMLPSWRVILKSSFPHHILNMLTNREKK